MFIVSGISSNMSWIPTINQKATHFHNYFGVTFKPKVKTSTSLQVKLEDVQDPLKFNNFGKIMTHELPKSNYVCDDYVVRQNFLVRLYELDIHQKASLETLLNYTQETSANLCESSGLVVGGFGVVEEMSRKNLIWVIGRIQVVVNFYPSWGDMVQVETWCSALGRHSLTSSSRLTDAKTDKKIMRVDSDFVMINEKSRRLSRIPEKIKARGEPYVRNIDPIQIADKFENFSKLQKIDEDEAEHVREGIKALWFDLDPNQHVNNVKYASWILEGSPERVRQNSEVEAIMIEYRRECGRDNVLKSVSVAANESSQQFHHLLVMEDGTEVGRARTLWRSKN